MKNMIPQSVSLKRHHRSWRLPHQPNKPLFFVSVFSLLPSCLLLDSAGSLIGTLFHGFGGLCLLSLPNNLGSSNVIKLAMHFFQFLYPSMFKMCSLERRTLLNRDMHCFDVDTELHYSIQEQCICFVLWRPVSAIICTIDWTWGLLIAISLFSGTSF